MRHLPVPLGLVLLFCVILPGCNQDDSDTIVVGVNNPAPTDNFPGGLVADNNLAPDGAAFSPNGGDYVPGSLKCVRNGDSGEAIVTFGVQDGTDFLFLASHFDGVDFTPPVQLLAPDQDPTAAPAYERVVVVFLNTSTFAGSNDPNFNTAVQDRDGDAVILHSRPDRNEPNARLYYSYFSLADRNTPITVGNVRDIDETLARGFTEFAVLLDELGETGEDVAEVGLISDGLCDTARWFVDGNDFAVGDEVTHVAAFWQQIDDADGADPADRRLFTSVLNLSNGLFGPPVDGGIGLAGADGVNFGVDRDETTIAAGLLLSNDNVGLNAYLDNAGGLADLVVNAIVAELDAGGIASLSSVEISPDHDGLDAVAELASLPTATVGRDQGLEGVFAYFTHGTSAALDTRDLFVCRIDGRSFDFDPADDLAQLSDNRDVFGVVLPSVRVAVNRTGDFTSIIWMQDEIPVVGLQEVGLFGTIVRDGAAPFRRGVAGGLIHDPMQLSEQAVAQDSVLDAEFQRDLGFGCGIQSDEDRINVLFLQFNGAAGGDALRVAQFDLPASETDAVAPNPPVTVDTAFAGGEFEGSLTGGGPDSGQALCIDAGGADGAVLVVYLRDNDGDIGDNTGRRLIGARADVAAQQVEGGAVVGNDDDLRDALRLLALVTTPKPAGAPGPAPAGRIDVLFTEERGDAPLGANGAGTTALVHRRYDADSVDVFQNRFLPAAPDVIDTGASSDATFAHASTTAVSNLTGVYFTQDGHIYYNEFDPFLGSWILSSPPPGVIEPVLVDNFNPADATLLEICERTCACDTLLLGLIIYSKQDAGGTERLFVRRR